MCEIVGNSRQCKEYAGSNAGNSHAACDVAGVGDGITELPKRATKVETPDTAKELPTDLRASARPYQVSSAREWWSGVRSLAKSGRSGFGTLPMYLQPKAP